MRICYCYYYYHYYYYLFFLCCHKNEGKWWKRKQKWRLLSSIQWIWFPCVAVFQPTHMKTFTIFLIIFFSIFFLFFFFSLAICLIINASCMFGIRMLEQKTVEWLHHSSKNIISPFPFFFYRLYEFRICKKRTQVIERNAKMEKEIYGWCKWQIKRAHWDQLRIGAKDELKTENKEEKKGKLWKERGKNTKYECGTFRSNITVCLCVVT